MTEHEEELERKKRTDVLSRVENESLKIIYTEHAKNQNYRVARLERYLLT